MSFSRINLVEITPKRCRLHPTSLPKMQLTPGEHHHGKWICSECDKFLTWAKSPKTNEAMKKRQSEIINYVMHNEISVDDLQFLFEAYSVAHLTLTTSHRYNMLMIGDVL